MRPFKCETDKLLIDTMLMLLKQSHPYQFILQAVLDEAQHRGLPLPHILEGS
jgi:hypothetical protein